MMLLRKTCDGPGAIDLIWFLEGKIVGEYASLLREEYLNLPTHSRSKLLLHLEEVSFVDGQGAQVLSRMQRDRVRLVGAGAFVKEILRKQEQEGVSKSA